MSAPSPAPQQTTQPPLLPTLYALLSPASLPQTQSSISLLSIHSEVYEITDKMYFNSDSVLPGQKRTMRLRITPRSTSFWVTGKKGSRGPSRSTSHNTTAKSRPTGNGNGNGNGEGNGEGEGKGLDGDIINHKLLRSNEENPKERQGEREGQMSLAYVSQALSGREYSDISVKAVVELDIGGLSRIEDVEDFIKTLGFTYSHEYSRKGLLFHIPLPHPSFTLHLTISRLLLPGDASEKDGKPTLEPFLVELHPAKPISGIATRGELGVSEMIQLIKGMAGRIDGLEWGTGR